MRVLFVAAESFPLVKVGGLADVASSLPKALALHGHDVRVALPFYARLALPQRPQHAIDLPVELGGRTVVAAVYQTLHPNGVPAYLVANDAYFGREHVYGYPDDDERFIFFCGAVRALLRVSEWQPDIVHCNDWHTAYLVYVLRQDALFQDVATVFTIHNLAYQGPYTERTRRLMGLPETSRDNLMALGIRYADALNTVSPTYLTEVLTPAFGHNMDGLLRQRLADFRGILNGVDYEEFDPRHDPHIPVLYGPHCVSRKLKNKSALQYWSRLPLSQTVPLLGVVARLTGQKGIGTIIEALDDLLDLGVQVVVMGRGEPRYEEVLLSLAQARRGAMAYHQREDETLARLVYAGADMLLAPSNFEPCGLGPLIAARYGTVPIVRATGGLADTILDCMEDRERGLGIVIGGPTPADLVTAVTRALLLYHRRSEWRTLVKRLMAADFSWERPSLQYQELYAHALRKCREANRGQPAPRIP